jgi:putative spermidine/putrescine transport system ATP-binding protein
MSTIALQNVAKSYGTSRAVEDMSLDIAQGEFVALLGPSGCGKTTTLRMIAGFIEATSGRILFDDRDVTRLPPNRRNAGMVFQGFALFPHMTVFENVAYGLQMRKVGKEEIKDRVAKILDRVQLGALASRLPKQLSGGQQQRVALARALVINPDVLLLDEPLSALDAKLRHEVRLQIRQLQQSLGLTTIFVTHDQEEALSLADRLVVMSNGRVEQIGSPSDLYEHPVTPFVADFIGKSNFLKGRLDGQVFTADFGARLRVAKSDPAISDGALAAVRPEKIRLNKVDNSRAAAGENELQGTIEFVSYLGPTTEYSIRVAENQVMLVHQQNESAAARADFTVGRPIMLTIEPENCKLFSAPRTST